MPCGIAKNDITAKQWFGLESAEGACTLKALYKTKQPKQNASVVV
jgi:hypothetical protein